ncbi:MAG: DEAD/DEAH box helicase, partial [Planctomycetales bacterium]|nr:DEAD/DEAH box helicase [Planctomycetales bacterium]
GCAQTGTGKTAAFSLPILNRLGKKRCEALPNRPLALVLAPTRELAIQISESFSRYGKGLQLRQALLYGGVSQAGQVRSLNQGSHIVVATPGRLIDLMNQGHIKLDQLQMFVLDEADRMLDMGFLPDLKRIIKQLPNRRQSLFFSATLPPKITELSKRLLRNPVSVDVTPKSASVTRIDQRVVFVERSGKATLLRKVLMAAEVDRALVFTRTRRGAQNLADRLARSGIKATAIHGNKSQNARQRALAAFQRKQVQVLVATDIAARGIDVDGISHVVNYDLPTEPESYVHRIGRTGRAGAEGIALSFCSESERLELRAIEKLIGTVVPLATGQLFPEPQERRPPRPSRDRHSTASLRTDAGFPHPDTSVVGKRDEENKTNKNRRVRRKRKSPSLSAK